MLPNGLLESCALELIAFLLLMIFTTGVVKIDGISRTKTPIHTLIQTDLRALII